MRIANIGVAIVTAFWFALFVTGRDGAYQIYMQEPGISPNAGQVDYYIVYPLVAALMLVTIGWLGVIIQRPKLISAAVIVFGFTLIPYLFKYTGGV